MSRLNLVLLLWLIAFAIGDLTRAKPLLENAVDMDIDLTAEESQHISHQVLKSAYLPRGYGWPRRHGHDDSAESSEEDDNEDHDFRGHGHGHGHGHHHYGDHHYGGGSHRRGHFGFGSHHNHPKPLPNVKCDCNGPSLTTPKAEGTPTSAMQTPATATALSTTTTSTTTLPPDTSTANVATDEPALDIDLRFGASNGMT